eukprot:TRINITY_DN4432_c0_g2_i1.p1 TRINITY_DN4432_c0_g2~~TRINITY_DN4432_c0_g2_i1.p1  ORF type:complete len:2537 (+),score=455.07 TRINITY_DN4432_c0_g2_i1:648-7613(+)
MALGGFEPEKLNRLTQELSRTSGQHEHIVKMKSDFLTQAQLASSQLWGFRETTKTQSALCRCGNHVSHTYSEKTCHLDQNNLNRLTQLVQTLHQLNCRGLWLSLYEQTLAELALSRSIHSLVQDPSKSLTDLLQGLDLVTHLLQDAKKRPGSFSSQSISVLRGLFLFIGSHILTKFGGSVSTTQTMQTPSQQLSNQFSLLDLSDIPPPQASAQSLPVSGNVGKLILQRIQQIGDAAEWAVQLLQPTPSDIASPQELWLQQAVESESHTQMEYLRLLGQIPWNSLASISVDAAKTAILLPLQRLLSVAAKKNYLSLIVNIGKATSVIACIFPELALSCIAVLMRSPWPSKAIAVPLLKRCFPMDAISRKDDALLLFGELYQMFQTRPQEYALLKAAQRQEHRDFYVNYLFSTQPLVSIVYQLDSNAKTRNLGVQTPLLTLLVDLALQFVRIPGDSSGGVDLHKLLVEELFYYAFVWKISTQQHLLLKQEAQAALLELCFGEIRSLDFFITEIGINLPAVNAQEIVAFLSKTPLKRWSPNDISSGWIGYFLSRRSFATLPPEGTREFELGVDSMINLFLVAPPQVQFSPQIQQAAFAIASAAFMGANWAGCSHGVVSKAILAVLASQGLVPEPWRRVAFTSLLSAQVDLQRLLGEAIASRVLRVEPKTEDPLLSLVQCRIALSYVVGGDEIQSSGPSSRRDFRWLMEWGLFRRLSTIANHGDMSEMVYRALLPQLFNCIRREPIREAFNQLGTVLDTLARVDTKNDFTRVVGDEMLRTLANSNDPNLFGSWITFWSHLLLPKLDLKSSAAGSQSTSRAYERLINVLVHGLFCNNANFEELSQLAKNPKTPSTHEILSCIDRGFIWTAYLACWAYLPRLSPPRNRSLANPDPAMQASSLWMFRECAMKIQEPRLALLFWERFFLLYFESCAIHADTEYFPAAWKEPLNQLFIQMAQKFDSRGKEKPFYHIYYAFTTWSKDVILTTGSHLFMAQNAELLHLFVHVYPPLFPRRGVSVPISSMDPPPTSSTVAAPYADPDAVVASHLSRLPLDQLIAELPRRVPFDPNGVSDEKTRFLTYKSELRKTIRDLQNMSSNSVLPVLSDLAVLLPQYAELSAAMEQADQAHLSILANMWFNERITITAGPKECYQGLSGGHCIGAAIFTIQTTRISQPPSIQEDIKQNRDMFNRAYYSFFSVARYLAHCVSVLSDITSVLVAGGQQHLQAGQYLFFSVLPFILQGAIPVYSPLTTHVVRRILIPLGDAFIRGYADAGVQKRLLRAFLFESKKMPMPLIVVDPKQSPQSAPVGAASGSVDLLSSSMSSSIMAPGGKSAQQMHLESLAVSSSPSLTTSMNLANSEGHPSTRFTETRANLYSLFTPALLLGPSTVQAASFGLLDLGVPAAPAQAQMDAGNYLELLFTLLHSVQESNLSAEEIKILSDQFEIGQASDKIISSAPSVQVERLFEVLELATAFSANSSFQALANMLMPKLLRYGFPHNVPRVVRIMLVQSGPNFKPNWDLIEDAWLHPELLRTVRNELPLPDDQLISGVQLARRVILSSSMRNQLISEGPRPYRVGSQDGSAWAEIESFITQSLAPLRGESSHVSATAFYALVELVVDVVVCTSPALVNRIWDLYSEIMSPYILKCARDIDMQRVGTLLGRLPWHDATFHLVDSSVVVALASANDIHAPVVRLLFCNLNWDAYAFGTNSTSAVAVAPEVDLLGDFINPQPIVAAAPAVVERPKTYAGKHVLHFLKLFIEMHVASPGSAPPSISSRVMSVSKNPDSWFHAENHIFDWRLVPKDDFSLVFDGSVLFRALLKAGPSLKTDPTPQLIECAMLLRDIARMHASSEALISCMKECRSVMFRVLSSLSADGQFWFLPPQEHVDLVNNVMIPLCQQFHGIQLSVFSTDDDSVRVKKIYSKVKYEPIAIMLSCVRARPGVIASWDWGEPYLADIRFFNSHSVPRSIRPQLMARGSSNPPQAPPTEVVRKKPLESEAEMMKQLETLNDRIYGLISRFCLSADVDLCLAILSQAYRGFGPGRLAVLMQVFDETLHAFFSSSGDAPDDAAERPMQQALRAIEPPDSPWNEIVDACISCHGSLALRVLLEQQRNYLANMQQNEWLAFMLTAVSCVTRFVPQTHHEFDLFPLWFFLIEMISDHRWPIPGTNPTADLRVEEILSYLNGFGQEATGFSWLMGGAASGIYKKFDHIYVPSKVEPHMQLAAQACIVFVKRSLLARDKAHGESSGSSAIQIQKQMDASQTLDKLLSLELRPEYKRYAQLFMDMKNLMAPTFDLVSFEASVCNTLAPIAPYLVYMLEQRKEAVLSL